MAYYPPSGSAKELIMDADVQLDYPYSANTSNFIVADIIEVTAADNNLKIILPNATESGGSRAISIRLCLRAWAGKVGMYRSNQQCRSDRS